MSSLASLLRIFPVDRCIRVLVGQTFLSVLFSFSIFQFVISL